MLTLRQALQLPCFAQARVVAGAGGLDRMVRRVHVIDMPDATFSWGQDALLLTAGYGLKDSPERQAALIPTLVARQLVGVVFSIGWYFDAVPAVIAAAADAHQFPVLVLPPEVQFVDITESLYAEIVNEQAAVRERAEAIHHQLTALALRGGDLTAVAEALAGRLGRPVLIQDVAQEVLAHAGDAAGDAAHHQAVQVGRAAPEAVQHLLRQGVFADLQQQPRAIHVAPLPEFGLTMARMVAPLLVAGDLYGYLWIAAGDRPLESLDELALGHATTVAALILMKQRAVQEAQQAERGDFLAQLLTLEGTLESRLLERAHMLGYRVERPHQVLVVKCRPMAAPRPGQLVAQVERWLRSQGEWAVVAEREAGVTVVLEARANATGQTVARALIDRLGGPGLPLVAGVGQVHPEDRAVRRSYEEARVAAEIAQRLTAGPAVMCHWELGLLDWLFRLSPEARRGNPYLAQVERLAQYDRQTHTELVATLEAYLEHGGAVADAAGELNIHRNTLLYRLGRIEAILGVDLKDVKQRLNLHVALKSYRLHGPG